MSTIAGKDRDAAAADVGVEDRHRAAARMAVRYRRFEDLRSAVVGALLTQRSACLDNDGDLAAVADEVVRYIAASSDARFLRELLGADPGDRITRMHAHGALMQRATDAAWRLAGGGPPPTNSEGDER